MRPKLLMTLCAFTLALWSINAQAGCNDPFACNYNSADFDTIDCVYPGCTDSFSCTYDPLAGCDDGSCLFLDVCGICGGTATTLGCTDLFACNYNSLADCEDGSCQYFDACGICGGAGSVPGCTDFTACNWDPLADCDDGSCSFLTGCMDPIACNYDSTADCDDGSCCFDNCLTLNLQDLSGFPFTDVSYSIEDYSTGTTVAVGGLFLAPAVFDNLCLPNGCYSITFNLNSSPGPIFWQLSTPDQGVLSGGDGTFTFSVNSPECFGCTNPLDCNYDSTVLFDDGSCIGEPGCTDSTATNYDSTAGCDDGTCIVCPPGEFPILLHMMDLANDGWNGASLTINDSGGSTVWVDQLSTGDSTTTSFCLPPDCYDVITDEGSNPVELTFEIEVDDGYHDDDIMFGTADALQTLSVGGSRGCTNPSAINYDSAASCDDASCYVCADDFFCIGNLPTACNEVRITGDGRVHLQDPGGRDRGVRIRDAEDLIWHILWGEAIGDYRIMRFEPFFGDDLVIEFADQTWGVEATTCFLIYIDEDGNCTIEEYDWLNAALGCTDSTACNFDSLANVDDGTCTFPACGDPLAVNYDSTATCFDNTLCVYIFGCTDSLACNYDSTAGEDDGTCTYPGCTYPTACNYDSFAMCDDASCEFESCYGCTDSTALNYDSTATMDDGSCYYETGSACPGDLNGDCMVDTADLLEFLTSFGNICIPCD